MRRLVLNASIPAPSLGQRRRGHFRQHPHHCAADVRIHREYVDHVGPTVAVGIAVRSRSEGDRITVGLVEDQNAAELVSR